jgi:hypothetical protein
MHAATDWKTRDKDTFPTFGFIKAGYGKGIPEWGDEKFRNIVGREKWKVNLHTGGSKDGADIPRPSLVSVCRWRAYSLDQSSVCALVFGREKNTKTGESVNVLRLDRGASRLAQGPAVHSTHPPHGEITRGDLKGKWPITWRFQPKRYGASKNSEGFI